MGAINGWAVLHVVVTIIEQRPTTDWREGGEFSARYYILQCKDRKDGERWQWT
jgi:hypothetical protein